jgi:amidase
MVLLLLACQRPPTGYTGSSTDRWLDRPMVDQIRAMERGRLSSETLTVGYITRIAQRDEGPDGTNAILVTDPHALEAARAADAARGSDARLQGAVILVKDNIDTAGLATTAGSLAMVKNVATVDAPVIAKIRAAHGVVLAKTNLSEWANFRGEKSSSGWSSLGGQTLNGANPAYNPCGSSSGSASAIARGMGSAALGTETDGSITCPAAVQGLVGMKPSVGLVSRTGVIPISSTQDTVGPITRDVADCARLLTVIAGPDPADEATAAIPEGLDLDFEKALDGATLEGARLGVVDTMTGYDSALDAVFRTQLDRLEKAGAVLVHVSLPKDETFIDAELQILKTEMKVGLDAYLASHVVEDQPRSLAELIAWNEAHAASVMPFFGQEYFVASQATTGLEDPAYVKARADTTRLTLTEGILAVRAEHDLHAFVAPTTGPAWVTDHAKGDAFGGSASSVPAVARAPHLTVPMGTVDGLPVGLSIFAAPFEDATVLRLGYAYEQLPR